MYWKEKFEQAQSLIRELNEKSIQLDEIPGLLTVKKIKPNLEKTSTRITQVHGSMRAKDVASMVKEIKDKKETKAKAKEEALQKKEENREIFLRCKVECVCFEKKCKAIGLKECPICKNVMKSVCSKASCKIDGVKPVMVLPKRAYSSKKLFEESSNEEESCSDDDEEDEVEDDDEEEDNEDCFPEEKNDEELGRVQILRNVWSSLSPPLSEEAIIGKWYTVIYQSKRGCNLFIGKVLRRFLTDENGPIESVEVRCLKSKVGLGTILEDTPAHLHKTYLFSN